MTASADWALLAALSLPPMLVFLQHAFGDRVQGNWPAIVYPAAVLAAAGLRTPRWVRLAGPAAGLGLAITGLVYVQAVSGLLPIPASVDPVARQLAGWQRLAGEVDAARRQAGAAFVVADQYALASELAWTLPQGTEVVGYGPRWALTTLPPAAIGGQAGLLVRASGRGDAVDPSVWRNVVPLEVAGRDGTTGYELFRVIGVTSAADAAVLPGR